MSYRRPVMVEIRHDRDDAEDHNPPITIATCKRCKKCVTIYGHGEASAKRACVSLREECPFEERNFYQFKPFHDDGTTPDDAERMVRRTDISAPAGADYDLY